MEQYLSYIYRLQESLWLRRDALYNIDWIYHIYPNGRWLQI